MTRYNAEELFRMAESVEREGMRFYRQMAQTVEHPEVRNLLSELADWEAKHEKLFAAMREELPETARQEPGPGDPLEEHAADYLQAFIEGKVFPGPSRTEGFEYPTLADLDALLNYAIGREKDTIVFFLTIQRQVLKYRGQERIAAIIDEELKHVHILERKRRELAGATTAGRGQREGHAT